jgi:hypothetical protein
MGNGTSGLAVVYYVGMGIALAVLSPCLFGIGYLLYSIFKM